MEEILSSLKLALIEVTLIISIGRSQRIGRCVSLTQPHPSNNDVPEQMQIAGSVRQSFIHSAVTKGFPRFLGTFTSLLWLLLRHNAHLLQRVGVASFQF